MVPLVTTMVTDIWLITIGAMMVLMGRYVFGIRQVLRVKKNLRQSKDKQVQATMLAHRKIAQAGDTYKDFLKTRLIERQKHRAAEQQRWMDDFHRASGVPEEKLRYKSKRLPEPRVPVGEGNGLVVYCTKAEWSAMDSKARKFYVEFELAKMEHLAKNYWTKKGYLPEDL